MMNMKSAPAPMPAPMQAAKTASVSLSGPLAASFAGRNVGESVSIEGKAVIESMDNGTVKISFQSLSADDDGAVMDEQFDAASKRVKDGKY